MKISTFFSSKLLVNPSKFVASAIALGFLWSFPVNAKPDYNIDLAWSAGHPESPGAYSYKYCRLIAAGSIASIYMGAGARYGSLLVFLETPRREVISLAKQAARSGDVEAAVGLAALTQCHNSASFKNMLRNPDGVYRWLVTH